MMPQRPQPLMWIPGAPLEGLLCFSMWTDGVTPYPMPVEAFQWEDNKERKGVKDFLGSQISAGPA